MGGNPNNARRLAFLERLRLEGKSQTAKEQFYLRNRRLQEARQKEGKHE